MLLITEHVLETRSYLEEGKDGKKNLFIEGIFAQADQKNHNGRIYPKAVLGREVKRYNESHIQTRRALGELNHPQCYFNSDFDVLTSDGWKKFADLTIGESVMSMDKNGNLVNSDITDITKDNDYAGDCIHICGRQIDSKVTPNHRFYVERRNGSIEVVTAQELYDNRHTSVQRHSKIIKQCSFVGDDREFITIPGVVVDANQLYKYKNDVTQDLIIPTDTFVKFLGFYLAEGHISKDKYDVSICQNEGDVSDMVDDMLSKFPSEIKVNRYSSFRESNLISWTFSDRRIHEYLSKLGNCYNKYIPTDIKSLSSNHLMSLVEWFGYGDGRKVINGSDSNVGKLLNIFSTSKQLVDDLQECVIKCGLSGNITISDPVGLPDYMFAGHLIETHKKAILYVLNISRTSGIFLDTRHKFFIDKVPHPAKGAYCITTEQGNFYIRDNGKAYLTGNSPTVNPERASHLITSLVESGSDYIGKAKVLNTPMGNLVRGLVEDGVSMGVSTRGMGTVTEGAKANIVNEDFGLVCVDVVADPSAPSAFVNGIMECKGFVWEHNEEKAERIMKQIKRMPAARVVQHQANMFENFIKGL